MILLFTAPIDHLLMTSPDLDIADTPAQLLQWHIDIGADDALRETPRNWFEDSSKKPQEKTEPPRLAEPKREAPTPQPRIAGDEETIKTAVEIAASCHSLVELKAALEKLDACPLKKTAQNLVFYDGHEQARILLLGEAPGADEDRLGAPFVGRSGQLLDKMLHTIGLDRTSQDAEKSVLISNMVFWRPPGNRKPTDLEIFVCLPFVERLISLMKPDIIMCLGATPMHRLIGGTQGILRARGKWQTYTSDDRSIPVLPTLHPAYLLRAPAQKKLSWQDFRSVKQKLDHL